MAGLTAPVEGILGLLCRRRHRRLCYFLRNWWVSDLCRCFHLPRRAPHCLHHWMPHHLGLLGNVLSRRLAERQCDESWFAA